MALQFRRSTFISCLTLAMAGFSQVPLQAGEPATASVDGIRKLAGGPPRPVAHRGCWGKEAPENSLMALRTCVRMGVPFVEVDIRSTRDDVLVLMHDDTLDRTTERSGSVSAYTGLELERTRLREGLGGWRTRLTRERIPTFREVLRMEPHTHLILDVKENNYDRIYKDLVAENAEKRATFLVYLSAGKLRNLDIASRASIVPVIFQCGIDYPYASCYSRNEMEEGKPFEDYSDFSPLAYFLVADQQTRENTSMAVSRIGARLMESGDDPNAWNSMRVRGVSMVIIDGVSVIEAFNAK